MSERLPGKVSTPKASASGKGKRDNVQRGTQDELEIIGLIICQNVGLRTLVMDRLKQAKVRGKSRDEVAKRKGSSND